MKPTGLIQFPAALLPAVLLSSMLIGRVPRMAGAQSPPQTSASPASTTPQLNESGYVNLAGRKTPYLIRHLPIDSFPDLPAAIQAELNRRGCLIPQTYAAHGPENVIHGAFEKAGSSDWAVLCSAHGTVSLLVFFAGTPQKPFTLASSPETQRLEAHNPTGALGFNWSIDAASPTQIHAAQFGMQPRPALLDHYAVSDSFVDRHSLYHFFLK